MIFSNLYGMTFNTGYEFTFYFIDNFNLIYQIQLVQLN